LSHAIRKIMGSALLSHTALFSNLINRPEIYLRTEFKLFH